jgi:hypothetical protein
LGGAGARSRRRALGPDRVGDLDGGVSTTTLSGPKSTRSGDSRSEPARG